MVSDMRRTEGSGRRPGRPGRSPDEVVAAALSVLERSGLEGFTVKSVARAVGVSEPAVFHHFPTKDALVGAVAAELARREVEHLLRAINGASSGVAALEAMLRAYVALYRDSLGTFRAHYYLPQRDGISREALEAHVYPLANALMGTVEGLLLKDQAAGRVPASLAPRRMANLVWTLGMGVCCRASLLETTGARTTLSLDEMVDEACKVLRLALSGDDVTPTKAAARRR